MSMSFTSAETQHSSGPPTVPPRPASTDTQVEHEIDAAKVSCELRQRSISVTLDGPTIFVATLALVLLMHYFEPSQAKVLVGLVPIVILVHNDYQNFLGLGPGGTPSTFPGYLRIVWFRLWALRNPFVLPDSEPSRKSNEGILSGRGLPYRAGPRPVVVGIAPQRQLDQHGSRYCYHALRKSMSKLAYRFPKKFGTERSCVEKHGLGLFARHPLRTTCQGEVCHVHDSDHSMHMCLHPADIKEVLAKGWGQMHPLAWRSRFLKSPVSPNFVMVYAPRDDQELQVICNIVEAAIWYTIDEDVQMDIYLKPS